MSKKVKKIIEKIKVSKKIQIGIISSIILLSVAGGTLAYMKYSNGKSEENKIEASESEADIILSENEDGELVATDKDGNVVASGDEVEKLVEEKKEKGETVVTKTEDGSTVKVDKVEGDKVTSSGGETVKPSPKPPVVADNNSTSKPNDNSSNNNNSNNNSNSNSGTNKPSNGNNGGNTSKPQEPEKPKPPVKPAPPVKPTPPEEPKPEKPEQPKRTWTYMADMSRETFNLMNSFRQQNGAAPLKWSDSEHSRAKSQAEYNIKNMDTGHGFQQISIGGTRFTTAKGFIDGWASSPGHKESMLDKRYIEGAVAVYKDNNGEFAVVASFKDDSGFDWD